MRKNSHNIANVPISHRSKVHSASYNRTLRKKFLIEYKFFKIEIFTQHHTTQHSWKYFFNFSLKLLYLHMFYIQCTLKKISIHFHCLNLTLNMKKCKNMFPPWRKTPIKIKYIQNIDSSSSSSIYIYPTPLLLYQTGKKNLKPPRTIEHFYKISFLTISNFYKKTATIYILIPDEIVNR